MAGLGTLINAAGLVLGGLLGLLLGKALSERFQNILICACGLSVIFIGASGALAKLVTVSDDGLSATGGLLLTASLGIGALAGELLDLEQRTERLGEWLKRKSGSGGDVNFVDAFVTASLTVCVGAMAVLGPINDALYGDISILVTKAVLDGVIIMAMASSRGKGCVFSVIPLVIFQGLMTLLAWLMSAVMTEGALANLSMVGSVLIFCVGVNLTFGKRIKVANLLPSLVVAVAAAFLPGL